MTESFPPPPRTITDRDGRTITLEAVDAVDEEVLAALVRMYDTFDPADRAQGIPPTGPAAIRDWLEGILGVGIHVLARHGARVVGHAMLIPEGTGEHELAIFVVQDSQGIGIGSALLETLLGAGQQAGLEYIWLTVERWNTVAVRLYRSFGFERTEAGNFELEMTLRLSPQTAMTG